MSMLLKEKSCALAHLFNSLRYKALIEIGGIQSLILGEEKEKVA